MSLSEITKIQEAAQSYWTVAMHLHLCCISAAFDNDNDIFWVHLAVIHFERLKKEPWLLLKESPDGNCMEFGVCYALQYNH